MDGMLWSLWKALFSLFEEGKKIRKDDITFYTSTIDCIKHKMFAFLQIKNKQNAI